MDERKNVVITGAASGLGRAIALSLAKRGWRILVSDINMAGSKITLEMVEKAGGEGETFECDVTKLDDIRRMADFAFKKWNRIDLLVNNAGVAAGGIVGDIPMEDWHWIVNTNFWGMLYGCHEFVPRMKSQGGGHIVNVSSAAGFVSLPEMASYNVTKAAIISLSETLKSELAPHNIGITVVCPTFFKTNLLETMRYTDEFQKMFAETAFENGRLSAEKIAEMTVRAVEKNKLYLIPQVVGKVQWVMKRFSPSRYYKNMAFMNRRSSFREMALKMARWGLT
ncbi:MAG: SDR family oxidoreductase [Deltaproteobacteria bacterium]|nr:SDR family oxidoreductase [Deltaproteobacteria bacterium]MBN2846186.1 SDR family oxidoreductase [Deltaproteobacteria bacterium]